MIEEKAHSIGVFGQKGREERAGTENWNPGCLQGRGGRGNLTAYSTGFDGEFDGIFDGNFGGEFYGSFDGLFDGVAHFNWVLPRMKEIESFYSVDNITFNYIIKMNDLIVTFINTLLFNLVGKTHGTC